MVTSMLRGIRRAYRLLFPPVDPRTRGTSPYPVELQPEIGTINGCPYGLMPMPDGSARLAFLTADRKGWTFAATVAADAAPAWRFEAAIVAAAVVECLGECTDLRVTTNSGWASAFFKDAEAAAIAAVGDHQGA